jgi:hypothetical protein
VEVRTELRRRQLILDTDDLTAALLERHHRISLLEKELVNLAARVGAAERRLKIDPPDPAAMGSVAAPPASSTTMPSVAQSMTPPVLPAASVASVDIVAKPAIPTRVPVAVDAGPPAWSVWKKLLIAFAVLSIAGAAIWFVVRIVRARDDSSRIAPQPTHDAFITMDAMLKQSAALSKPVTRLQPTQSARADVEETLAQSHGTAPQVTGTSAVNDAHIASGEIHFELPAYVTSSTPPTAVAKLSPGNHFDLTIPAANVEMIAPAEDMRARRMRYLQSRYQDIAIMKPPLDAPQRLLNQAGRINDEGAAEFAKHLLKYAAYSRPQTEEFWLALLEHLYLEKFANDFIVNAKWFRQYHPHSKNWDEVQRIGYLLDPTEPLFASAAASSREPPAIGMWLPANQPAQTPPVPRTPLSLELAS